MKKVSARGGLHPRGSGTRGAPRPHGLTLFRGLLALGGLGVAVACGPGSVEPPPSPRSAAAVLGVDLAGYEGVEEDVADDLALEALIAPYRDQMGRELTQVLGHAEGAFSKSDPEGALDNLVADALLDEVNEMETPVDMVLLNDGGLRIPLPSGPLTVSQAYELLPFENYVTVLTFTGRQIEALADEIARTGGEPVAGWTLRIADGEAVDVRINGSPVDPEARYRLATVDYLADGGGSWTVLWEAADRVDLPVLIRDVFMEYVREEGTVRPRLDGRIREASRDGAGASGARAFGAHALHCCQTTRPGRLGTPKPVGTGGGA